MERRNLETAGERIKSLRVQNNLTQDQIAEMMNFGNKGMVSAYETGKRPLTVDVLLEYAEKFNVSIDWILIGKNTFVNVDEGVKELIDFYMSIDNMELRKAVVAHVKAISEIKL